MDDTTNTDPVAFDASLALGAKVTARWTNCGRYYKAPATVAKLNGKSLIVTIDEAIDNYPQGWRITLPRLMGSTWSANNCAAPVTDVSAVADLERALERAQAASTRAMDRRRALPPGSSRARVTTANANWARAAEHRDRCADRLEAARAALHLTQPGSSMSTMSYAAVHRLAVRDALRIDLARELASIYNATHVAAEGARVYCYGSRAECEDFATGLHRVEVRAITAQEQHEQAQYKRQVYRRQGA